MAVLAGGFVLLAVLCAIGWSRDGEIGLVRGARAFVPLWFVAVLVELTAGIVGARGLATGTPPSLAATFLVPVATAWSLGRGPLPRQRPSS